MTTYKIQVRHTSTEVGYCYIEASTVEEAEAEFAENAKEGYVGRFDPEETVEEQWELDAVETV